VISEESLSEVYFCSFLFFLNKHILLHLLAVKNIQNQKSMIILKAQNWEAVKERQNGKERKQEEKSTNQAKLK